MSEMNEYSSLHNGALFFDRSDRIRMRISGQKAAELVTGMVTNDVSALVPGEGQYAAALDRLDSPECARLTKDIGDLKRAILKTGQERG